jgi:thymidylate synthase
MKMNNYEKDYKSLVHKLLSNGTKKRGRNGDTRSSFGLTLRVDLNEGFPLLTGRRMFIKGIAAEMACFIRGCEILGDYKEFGCNYWDTNAENWSPNFGKSDPNDMSIGQYVGSLWRDFSAYSEKQYGDHTPRDQLRELVHQLEYNPSSRRHVLSAWHPGAQSCLPPCTVMAIFNVEDGRLHCHVTQRSADVCLGVPSDVAGYAILVELLAKEVGLKVGTLMFTFVDAHIYGEHIIPFLEYFSRPIENLPKAALHNHNLYTFVPEDLRLSNYKYSPAINFQFIA